jgi:cell wall-associated NlpC family hydrolase
MPFRQCAALRIGNTTMQQLHTSEPVLPVGDYVLCRDNDERHALILGRDPKSAIHLPLATLARGQRTDEAYETRVDEQGWEEENPNRPNDGVKMMFSEVVSVGPEVPPGRLEPGDMVAFRPNICGIRFDLFGVSYRLVRCSQRNSETMGKVPKAVFERMLGKAS